MRKIEDYIKKSKERQITAASNSTDNIRTNRKTRKQIWEEKKTYGYFKRQTCEIKHEKTWTKLRKGNLKRGIETLLIETQNNAIKTNYAQMKIDNRLQVSKCWLRGDKDD